MTLVTFHGISQEEIFGIFVWFPESPLPRRPRDICRSPIGRCCHHWFRLFGLHYRFYSFHFQSSFFLLQKDLLSLLVHSVTIYECTFKTDGCIMIISPPTILYGRDYSMNKLLN